MENEKLLPKPLTDLPLPEKELSEHAAPAFQGVALQNQKTNILKSKFFILFVGISFLIAFLIGGFMLAKNNSNKEVVCTLEAKICPDGSSVGRSGPECEFSPCPTTKETPTTPKPSIRGNRDKIVKYIILKNITVCNVDDKCHNLTLSDDEVNKIKSEANEFQQTVNGWMGGDLKIKVIPVVIADNIKTEFTTYSYPAEGWTLKRENVPDAVRNNVDKNTDFVLLTNSMTDKSSGYKVPASACGYSYGATDFDSIGGTSFSWIQVGCAGAKAMIHEWMHQLTFNLRDFNGLNDIYSSNYPQSLCENTNPEDNYKWFPDIDKADKVPDFEACKSYYDQWYEYCSDIKPEDCDYKFDKHVLQTHFPKNIDFIGNYCRNAKKDYTETDIDKGPECN